MILWHLTKFQLIRLFQTIVIFIFLTVVWLSWFFFGCCQYKNKKKALFTDPIFSEGFGFDENVLLFSNTFVFPGSKKNPCFFAHDVMMNSTLLWVEIFYKGAIFLDMLFSHSLPGLFGFFFQIFFCFIPMKISQGKQGWVQILMITLVSSQKKEQSQHLLLF